MSSTPQSAIVAAGVGATVQLFRLAADLISTASTRMEKDDEKLDAAKGKSQATATRAKGGANGNNGDNNKKSNNDNENAMIEDTAAAAAAAAAPIKERRRRTDKRSSATRFFDGRLTIARSATGGTQSMHLLDRSSLFKSGGRGGTGASAAADGGGSSNTNNRTSTAAMESPFRLEEARDDDGPPEEPKVGLEKHMPMISLTVQVLVFVYLLVACILSALPSSPSVPYREAVYYVLQSHPARGMHRPAGLARVGWGSGSRTNLADWATMAVLIVYAVLALAECKVCRYPQPRTKGEKKASLSKRAILVTLRPYFWPNATATSALTNRIRAIMTWVCVGSAKACNLTAPIMLGRASTALSRGDYAGCVRYSCLYATLNFAGAFFKESQSLVYLKVAQAAFVQLSEVAFRHLHSLSLDWHLKKKLGEVLRSMDRGIAACDTLMKFMFLWLIPAIAECLLVVVIFATYFDYFPLAVSVFFFVFVYMVWTVLVTLWRKKFRKQVTKSDNDFHDICADSLINFETVKYFTGEAYEMRRFSRAVETYQSGSVNVAASLSFLNISQNFLLQCCLATSLTLAAYAIRGRADCCVAQGCEDGNSLCCADISYDQCPGMEVGDFVTVLTYTLQLFMPLNFLGSVYNAIVMAFIDLANLSELLAENPDVSDASDATPLPATNEEEPDIAVEFDDVIFHYPSQSDSQGLKGVSFKLKRGTTTAVVGSTGAGKTTVSRLLFRFYDCLGGAVKVNGRDVRTITQRSLREAIGVVPQATTMFNDTLKANIAYGRRDATDEEIEKAAEDAQLSDFVKQLPDGWETMVGDRGLKLSGGEKQRAAIARCLLKDPQFIILDEATSALDTVTENSIQEALNLLGSDRTCLVIAHRLGTIRHADKILVLNDGLVAEEGTHEELLAKGGQYANMWNMQLHSTGSERGSTANLKDLDA
eukprot:CAMPEP_0178642790 /NCGR_PEP_ID=MMETSP0698-20121128/17362_1 /TAXON_ID=265572 /ORGANISM="Extubocellulus spinifer, Strain CCMP396" /LENGTH=934 /DNA_ID=CAMNT_0020283569 /DNA_START=162 /DNA_END=2967 /DNA_ORIENTATION=+